MARNERARPRILVVEDDAGLRELLRNELEDAGYRTAAAADAEQARAMIGRERTDLVVSDLRLPGDSGRDLLDHCRGLDAPPGFIMITAFGTVEQAVEALKRGADDFLTKPLRLDHLRLAVARVLEARRLRSEVSQYRKLLGDGEFHGMVGRSAPMRRLFDAIRQVAPLGGPVIITGESGTGKELVARALHAESPRRDAPFVPLNCAAMPPELMESELFGHARGAFTGATQQRPGLFVEADGGTLLLDEIGEMQPDTQAKLLRVLEDGCIRPLGADREIKVDVRLVAATNRDLEAEVAAGRFRQDLFFRLETFPLHVPPLRERGEDLDLLAAHFIARFARSAPATPRCCRNRRSPACAATPSRATCASCRMRSSAPPRSARDARSGRRTCRIASATNAPAPLRRTRPRASPWWTGKSCRRWRRSSGVTSGSCWSAPAATSARPPRCSASGAARCIAGSTKACSNLAHGRRACGELARCRVGAPGPPVASPCGQRPRAGWHAACCSFGSSHERSRHEPSNRPQDSSRHRDRTGHGHGRGARICRRLRRPGATAAAAAGRNG
jgi:DNA-binding NtrC family response regulator